MKNYIQEGKTLTLTAPYAVASGAGFQVGRIFAVATAAADNAATVEGATEGVFELTKVGSQAWTVGAAIYWDNGNTRCTTVGTGSLLIGTAVEAVGSGAGETLGKVRLNGMPNPVAANVADAASGSAGEINALRDALVAAGLMASA